MNRYESGQERSRSVFINIVVVLVFAVLMISFIIYFNKSEPNIKKQALETLADQFSISVTNAHWQWQAEGRPQLIMLVQYDAAGREIDRRPVRMSHLGWPKSEPTSEGCGDLWDMILNVPMTISGFKVYPEYYDGVKVSDNALESKCRFRLSTGPYFEYMVYSGQVQKQPK